MTAERNPTLVRDLSRKITIQLSEQVAMASSLLDTKEDRVEFALQVLQSVIAFNAATVIHEEGLDSSKVDGISLGYAALDQVRWAGVAAGEVMPYDDVRRRLGSDLRALLQKHLACLPLGPDHAKLLQWAAGLAIAALAGTMTGLSDKAIDPADAAKLVADNLASARDRHAEARG